MSTQHLSCLLLVAGCALCAAPDPDIFDGRVSAAEATGGAPGAMAAEGAAETVAESASGGADGADAAAAESGRDFEALGGIGGEPVASGGSKDSATQIPGGTVSGSGVSASSGESAGSGGVGASAETAGTGGEGEGGAAGAVGNESERDFDAFGVGTAGTDTTVEVNRSKVSLPPGPVIEAGTKTGETRTGGEPQKAAPGGTTSGKSGTDSGTDLPPGL